MLEFFRRKKNPNQSLSKQNETSDSVKEENKDIHAPSFSFEVSQRLMLEKSEAHAWALCKLMGLVLISLIAAICIMMPLKQTVPFVIEVDRHTGMTHVVEIADKSQIPVSEVMNKFWLAEYVRARETYEWTTVDLDFRKVRELSVPEVFTPYSDYMLGDESPDKLLGNKKGFRVELISIHLKGNGIATVRFVKRLYGTTNMAEEIESYWTATIRFNYFPTYTANERDRLLNPFGFKVLSYRLDQEFTRESLERNTERPTDYPIENSQKEPVHE